MENQLPDTQLNTQQRKIIEPFVITIAKQENPKKTTLALFGIVIFFFSAFLGYILLLNFSNGPIVSKRSIMRHTIIATSPMPILLFEATQGTKIAKTLDVPELYKFWIWNEVEQSADNENLREIKADSFNKQYVTIPFSKGKMYTATNSIISNPDVHLISNYYAIQLIKLGWAAQMNDPYLTFQSFRLLSDSVDGSCDGRSSYIGYKDGMVRLVSVAHSVQPCSSSTKAQNSNDVTRSINYTVFISDPVSVRSLSDYFISHMKQ